MFRILLGAGCLVFGAVAFAQSPAKPGAPPTPPAALAKFGMSVVVQTGSSSQPIAPVMARVMRIVDRVDSARAAAIAMPVGRGGLLPTTGTASITYLWVIDQVTGARVVAASAPAPAFVVRFRDAPGVSPEDVAPALVQLIGTAAGPRVMSALRGRVDQATRTQADWDLDRELKQELVSSTFDLTSRGVARITPVAALAPGDYAVVMRASGTKKFAGASVLSEAEEGRVFGMAWVFVVK